jgi:hypothetical protein
VVFAKISGCQSSKSTFTMNQVYYKERTKTTMVTKNWISKGGLSRLTINALETFLLTNGENESFLLISHIFLDIIYKW